MRIPLKDYRELLWRYLAPQRIRVLLLGLLLCADIALQLINPQFLRTFIDTITSSGPQPVLLGLAILFIIVALVQQLVTIAATYISERLAWIATNALRADLALHLVRMDMSFHKVHTPGEMIERVDGDVTNMANFFSQFVIKILGGLLLLLGILVILWYTEWHVGLALSVFAIIALISINAARGIAIKPWKAFRQTSAELFGFWRSACAAPRTSAPAERSRILCAACSCLHANVSERADGHVSSHPFPGACPSFSLPRPI
ncbi:hypothetical protein KDH_33820 [Dictyobacter sp. S3.2.2.5]|uniref:ABC transmembrane type-1 domain-containing protein n=1 Tax=Dictyobacter halimunensis TaxID=3026934 RepID=A0ABQ6FVH5_9CHLR|nr:hypothetical protein KDH_33820 [Dictyobacter sp. S3.2.2.5]